MALLFLPANCQKKDSFTFSEDEVFLSSCVEDYLLKDNHWIVDGRVANVIADFVAKIFSKKTKNKTALKASVNSLFYELRHNKRSHPLITHHVFSTQLQNVVKKALEYCSIGNRHENKEISSSPDWFHFSRDEVSLSNCIQDSLLKDENWHEDVGVAKALSDIAARRFFGKFRSKEQFFKDANSMFYKLRNNKNVLFRSPPNTQLRMVIRKALESCANIYFRDQTKELYMTPVPIFVNEPPEVADVLDLILVDWPSHPYQMIQSRDGRILLRRYANDALAALERVLHSTRTHNDLRFLLQKYWICRAVLYFDGSNNRLPYLDHRYTMDNSRPHMTENMSIFISRSSHNFNVLSPLEPQCSVDRIGNIHFVHCSSFNDESQIFAIYNKFSMSGAAHYLENHINQFYQIVFFFLELRLRGISTDEDDVYSGSLPTELMPEEFQEILYDTDIYRDYLSTLRQKKETNNIENVFRQNFEGTSGIQEEDLVTFLMQSCFEESNGNGHNRSDYSSDGAEIYSNYIPLPNFNDELFEVGLVLDYVLVIWPTSLHEMIQTKNGRALLRRYANDAQMILTTSLLGVESRDCFRSLLRTHWMHRAQLYFDGHDRRQSYIHYLYSLEYPVLHMREEMEIFFERCLRPFRDRNPLMSQPYVDKILHIHDTDRTNNSEFSKYKINGMSSADYYIESHIDQFYRVLFFILKLKMYGIATDEDDHYDGPLPNEVMPDFLQAIVFDDESYRKFLLYERKRLQTTMVESQPKSDSCSVRVCEEDLFSSFSFSIMNSFTSAATTTSTDTPTSTTVGVTSTTSHYNKKKKGSFYANEWGKHFAKRPRTTYPDSCCDNGIDRSDANNFNEFTDSCVKERYNNDATISKDSGLVLSSMISDSEKKLKVKIYQENYGFYEDDLSSPHEESSVFIKILNFQLETFIRS